MALSREEVEQIAKSSAQSVLEGLHRYTVDYKEPDSIEKGLQDSMVEERTAANWYRKRAEHAATHGDPHTAALHQHIADEEDTHWTEFNARLLQISKDTGKPTRDQVRVERWEERDRLHIGIQVKDTGEYVADWWDDEARQMFEDGFFKSGMHFENSVLEYAEDMG